MNKPVVKNLLLIGIPTIISGIGIIMTLDILSAFKNIFVLSTIILLVVFIIIVIYYARFENGENVKYQELTKEANNLKATITSINKLLNAHNSIVTSFVDLLEPWATNINKIANDISAKGTANEKDWDYEQICTDICISCKKMIKHFTGITNDTDISVAFVKYYPHANGDFVKMIAHSSPPTAKPDIFDVQESLADCQYQYAKLIKNKTRTIFVLENNEKIKNTFYRKHPETDLSQYSQYIAIPIVCSRNKYLGVLQITAKYNYQIMPSDVDLKKFSETYVTPFVEMFILIEKIQKGLFIKPSV